MTQRAEDVQHIAGLALGEPFGAVALDFVDHGNLVTVYIVDGNGAAQGLFPAEHMKELSLLGKSAQFWGFYGELVKVAHGPGDRYRTQVYFFHIVLLT